MQREGFILTGGQSSRMGRDKALLPWKDATMVEHLSQVLQLFAVSVTLVGEPARYTALHWPCLPDLRPGLGPLAGLETALSATATIWSIVLPCDVAGITSGIVSLLCEAAGETDRPAVLLRDGLGHIHPLCGLYRRDCLAVVQRALDAGKPRVMDAAKSLRPFYVDVTSIVRNMNTPEEWRAASLLPELSHGK